MISVMLPAELRKLAGVVAHGMWIAVRLVVVVMGVKADKILFDKEFQLGSGVDSLTTLNTHIFARGPQINDRTWNRYRYSPTREGARKMIAR